MVAVGASVGRRDEGVRRGVGSRGGRSNGAGRPDRHRSAPAAVPGPPRHARSGLGLRGRRGPRPRAAPERGLQPRLRPAARDRRRSGLRSRAIRLERRCDPGARGGVGRGCPLPRLPRRRWSFPPLARPRCTRRRRRSRPSRHGSPRFSRRPRPTRYRDPSGPWCRPLDLRSSRSGRRRGRRSTTWRRPGRAGGRRHPDPAPRLPPLAVLDALVVAPGAQRLVLVTAVAPPDRGRRRPVDGRTRHRGPHVPPRGHLGGTRGRRCRSVHRGSLVRTRRVGIGRRRIG